MLVSEIMTSPVKTVGITTPAQEIAALLAEVNISGVPVVDAKGGLVGIVSEADLMHRSVQSGSTTGRGWLAGLSSPDALARAFAKAHGRIAADLMTKHLATIRHDATLAEVAEIMTAHGVKRLPVLRDGKLVGIVTRRDLVRAFAQSEEPPVPTIGNAHLQKALLERMAQEPWLDASYINVLVRNDVIELSGYVPSVEQKRAVEALVGELDQRRRLVDKLEIGLPTVSDFA
jgi:CBS domain-containing protein